MKKFLLAGLLAIVLGLSSHANAELQNLGCGLKVDSVCQGNLIYDTVANVTWFDYTYKGPCPTVPGYDGATIDEAKQWVAGLTVAGVTNWKLPTMQLPEGCLPANLNDLLNPCVTSNFTCIACRPLSFSVYDIAGYLYWIALGGSTFWGTDPFSNIDTRTDKYYWTSTALLNQVQLALSFEFGQVNILTSGNRYYAMAVHGGKVNPPSLTSVAQVQTSLTDFRGQMKNEKDAALLEDAIQHLANAQDPAFWKPTTTEDNQVQYILNPINGKEAFREAELAVQSLNTLIARGYAVLQRFVDETIDVARWLAQNAISDAIAANRSQNIGKAMDEMGKATEDALQRYGKAWEAATK